MEGEKSPFIMGEYTFTEENFLLYMMKFYDNPGCTGIHEFHDDLKRIRYIRRLLRKYVESSELRERLILNHIIVLNNLFGVDITTKALLFKIESEYHQYLKPFMAYLNMPVELDGLVLDEKIITVLRNI